MNKHITFLVVLGICLMVILSGMSQPVNMSPVVISGSPSSAHDPVIFIPGIQGSQLVNIVNGHDHLIWINYLYILPWFNLYRELDVLALAPDGLSPADPTDSRYTTLHTLTGTSGLILNVAGPWPFTNLSTVYRPIVDHFTKTHGYIENTDFWAFPYDWRKDNALSAAKLDILINNIIQQTGHSQVTIVAHSMGGLVTRQYISDPVRAGKVKQAIMIATPFIGTPDAFDVQLEGSTLMTLDTIFGKIDFPPKSETLSLVPNFPAFCQLFPSRAYFTIKGGGFYGDATEFDIKKGCKECLTFPNTYTTTIANNLNVVLATQADEFHKSLDQQTNWNSVKVDLIGGVGESTTVGLQAKNGYNWQSKQNHAVITPIFAVSGDGTVTSLSSSLYNPLNGINLRGTASYNAFKGNHIGLTQDTEGVLPYLDQLLGLTTSKPVSVDQADINTESLAGVQVTAYSADSLIVYDAGEDFTGFHQDAGVVISDIEGSAFNHTEAMATVGLINGQPYTVTIEADGFQPVDLSMIQSNYTETLTVTLFTDIRLSEGEFIILSGDLVEGEYTIKSETPGSALNVTMDISPTLIYTSSELMDVTAPEVQVSIDGTRGPDGWYTSPVTVTITASDNVNGSGVARIQYAFNTDNAPRYYEEPFVVDPQLVSFLYVNSTDKAQNISATTKVVIGPQKSFLPWVTRD